MTNTHRLRNSLWVLEAFPHALLGLVSQTIGTGTASVESMTRCTQEIELSCVLVAEAAGKQVHA
jgi:hypothetical protein